MATGRIPTTANSPLTAKGDLFTFSTGSAKLAVGSNNTTLIADSAEATGLKYAASLQSTLTTTGDSIYASAANTPARLGIGSTGQVLTVAAGLPSWATPSASGMTLISTTTLSGASTSVASIPATYVNLYVIIRNFDPATDAASLNMKFNAHTTYDFQSNSATANFSSTAIPVTAAQDNGTSNALSTILISNYAGTTWKMAECMTIGNNSTTPANYQFERSIGFANLTSAIDTLVFTCSSGNFSGGTVLLYGVK